MLKPEGETEKNVNKLAPWKLKLTSKRNQIKLNLKLFQFFQEMTSLMMKAAKKNSRRHPTNFVANYVSVGLQNKAFNILFSGSVGKLSFDLPG